MPALAPTPPRAPLAPTSADEALRSLHADVLRIRIREGSYTVDPAAVAGVLLERLQGGR